MIFWGMEIFKSRSFRKTTTVDRSQEAGLGNPYHKKEGLHCRLAMEAEGISAQT